MATAHISAKMRELTLLWLTLTLAKNGCQSIKILMASNDESGMGT